MHSLTTSPFLKEQFLVPMKLDFSQGVCYFFSHQKHNSCWIQIDFGGYCQQKWDNLAQAANSVLPNRLLVRGHIMESPGADLSDVYIE